MKPEQAELSYTEAGKPAYSGVNAGAHQQARGHVSPQRSLFDSVDWCAANDDAAGNTPTAVRSLESSKQRAAHSDLVKKTARKPRVRSTERLATHHLEDHLAAAQQLAKKMRRQRRPKDQRQKEGLAICAHLIAHLKSDIAPAAANSSVPYRKKVEQKPH